MALQTSPAQSHCTLDQLDFNQSGSVTAIAGDIDLRRRLMEMGFTHGVEVEFVRRAPMGDPIEYKIRGYHLSLRQEQAKQVRVQLQAK